MVIVLCVLYSVMRVLTSEQIGALSSDEGKEYLSYLRGVKEELGRKRVEIEVEIKGHVKRRDELWGKIRERYGLESMEGIPGLLEGLRVKVDESRGKLEGLLDV